MMNKNVLSTTHIFLIFNMKHTWVEIRLFEVMQYKNIFVLIQGDRYNAPKTLF